MVKDKRTDKMIIKKAIHVAFFSGLFFLQVLFVRSGYGESISRDDEHEWNDIPQGVYTYDYKSLYVKQTRESRDRLILKSFLVLNIKSSWSGVSDKITFIQVPLTDLLRSFERWTPAVCVIRSDGSNFKRLTDGRFGDFNPTWIRNKDEIVFTRLDKTKEHYAIYLTTPESVPGQEMIVSDPEFDESCCTSVNDGRLLVQSDRSGANGFYLLEIARNRKGVVSDKPGKYLKIKVDMPEASSTKRIVRESVSPDSTKLVFEYSENVWDMEKSVVYYADLHISSKHAKISNARPIISNGPEKSYTTIYPKWTAKGDAILFISNQDNKYRIYQYTLSTGVTEPLSPNDEAAYTYYCPKNIPN